MGVIRSIAGMMEVEITSADLPGALAAILERNIPVFSVTPKGDLTLKFYIYRKDLNILSNLCNRRGETLHVVHKTGLYWAGRTLLKRPVLLVGIAFLLFVVLFLPTRIYFVQVEGNSTVPARQILAAAEESGIRFGASRREVRSERMKNALLEELPQLQWAGVNTSGCVAIISVRERTAPEKVDEKTGVSSIVAACDGIVISTTVTQGNALCQPGQAVQEGQVLISGYTDCGLCIQATRAEGEVFAQTQRNLTAVMPAQVLRRQAVREETSRYSVLVGKKRINLWKGSGIWDGSCGRMYEEYYITLPGGFQLPFAIVKETITHYTTESAQQDQTFAESDLAEFSKNYLLRQMLAGKIMDSQMEMVQDGELYRMESSCLCTEMIGRVRQEKIGEYHGKSDGANR